MNFVNKYLRNLKPYELASHKIWTMAPGTRGQILKLDWNEATIPPSPRVIERIKEMVMSEDEFYNYYPSTYNEELLGLLSAYTGLPAENIQYFSGSDSVHEYVTKMYITVGDPILILGPTYDNFRLAAEACGAHIYFNLMDDGFAFDPDAFADDIRRLEPSLVYICNPNNPTGTQHTVPYIESLLSQFPQTLFLIDEAYAEFSGVSAKELVLRYENIIISRTMSKAFALANFRFGYIVASARNIACISGVRNAKSVSTFAQAAAAEALKDTAYMERYVSEVLAAKKQFTDDLSKCGDVLRCVSGGGNFVLVVLKDEHSKRQLVDYLRENMIYVRELSQTPFLAERCMRVTIGTGQQMKLVSDSIAAFFDKR